MRSKFIGWSGGWWLSSWLGVVVVMAMVLLAAPVSLMAEDHGSTEGQHEAAAGEEREATGEVQEGAGEEHAASEEHGEAHGEEHHLHKHHFAVILSSTEAVEEHVEEPNGDGHGEPHSEGSNGGKDDPDFTIGFDYERRFTQLFGVGGMFDWVVEGRREFLLGPIAFLHPFAGSKFWLAPLAERVRETGDWDLVWRIGAGWDFTIGKSGKYSISPNVNYDITDEHELWVFGVAFGLGF